MFPVVQDQKFLEIFKTIISPLKSEGKFLC